MIKSKHPRKYAGHSACSRLGTCVRARAPPPSAALADESVSIKSAAPKVDGDDLIQFNDVWKSFGSNSVLRGASFSIKRGEAVGIIGGSGTGKSTTLRLISGLLQPDAGEVIVNGKHRVGLLSDDDESAFGLSTGLVFQNAALFDSLTVLENVGFQLMEHTSMPEEDIRKLVISNLNKVGLFEAEDLFPSQLSGGMKKRVALARAITTELQAGLEKLIMYDEPTAGLDPVASTIVEDLMRSLHTPPRGSEKPSGVTSYIVVTHQHSTIRRAVDRLIFLHQGKVVWQGPTAEFDTSDNSYVKQFSQGLLEGPIQYV